MMVRPHFSTPFVARVLGIAGSTCLFLLCAAPASAQRATVEYIAHAAFRIESSSGSSVLIDPYASRVWLGYDFPEGVSADAILVTHPHYDHDAGQRRGQPFPWPGIEPITEPGEYAVGDIRVIGVRGKHADPYGMEFGQKNTLFVIEVDGLRIGHVGDNGPLSEETVRVMGPIDILMLPIDAEYHILAAAEIEAIVAAVRPLILVPMHYRIDGLETDPDSPRDLGPIDPWLADKEGVVRLEGHRSTFERASLPDSPQIVVFRHAPSIPRR